MTTKKAKSTQALVSARRRRGRPLSATACRMPIVVRFTESERHQLDRIAQENDHTLTEFIRKAVRGAVADYTDAAVLRESAKAGSPRRRKPDHLYGS